MFHWRRLILPAWLMALFLTSGPGSAQECLDYPYDLDGMELTDIPGPVLALAPAGHLLFAACAEGGLWVLDAGDPEHLWPLAQLALPGPALDLAVDGDFVYLACGEAGLQIVDAGQPGSPALTGSLATGGNVEGVCLVGGRAYLYGTNQGCTLSSELQVVDISAPGYPVLIGSFGFGAYLTDLSVEGGLAFGAKTPYFNKEIGPGEYMCLGDAGFEVLDLSDPDLPAEWAENQYWDMLGEMTADCCELVDGYGYYGYRGQTGASLEVRDLSDPTAPLCVTTLNLDLNYVDKLTALHQVGGVLYAVSRGGHLLFLDVADPASPVLAEDFSCGTELHDVATLGDRVYLACGASGVRSLEVNDTAAPTLRTVADVALGIVPEINAGVVYVDGNYGYNCRGDLKIVDLGDPSAPTVAGTLSTRFSSCDHIWVDGDLAYLDGTADPQFDIGIFDVSDRHDPLLVDYLNLGEWYETSLAADNGILFRGFSSQIKVYDVADPRHPVDLGAIPIAANAPALAVRDGVLYAFGADSTNPGRFFVYDVSDPSAPVLLDSVPAAGSGGITLGEDRAYLYSSTYFTVMDLSDPVAPVALGSFPTNGYCTGAGGDGSVAYIGTREFLYLFQAVNPADGPFASIAMNAGLFTASAGCLVVNTAAGLQTLPLDCRDGGASAVDGDDFIGGPTPAPALRLLGGYPNPFNPSVRIAFETEVGQVVRIRVVDLQGRLVARVSEVRYEAGTHEVHWDGKNDQGLSVASGNYLAELESATGRVACKLTLIR